MTMHEMPATSFDPIQFIGEQAKIISEMVGPNGTAVNALSGGVNSSAVTMIGHRALGDRLLTCFIDSGLMREGEPKQVVSLFHDLGVRVQLIDARDEFLNALKGIRDPVEKRKAFIQTFYHKVFGRIVRETGAKYLLQGPILWDGDEGIPGIKRLHNMFEQLGINPPESFGYTILEPPAQLQRDSVRKVAEALGLPSSVFDRIPFPSLALAARIVGEATAGRLELIRKATAVTEECLGFSEAFQYMAILHEDRMTGMRAGKREFGLQIEIRCWDAHDGLRAFPTRLDWEILENLSLRILDEVPGIVSVTYNIAPRPPSALEAV